MSRRFEEDASTEASRSRLHAYDACLVEGQSSTEPKRAAMQFLRTALLGACLAGACVARAAAADAVPTGSAGGLALGANWGAYETFKGVSFRWVADDAEIVLRGGSGEAQLAIACSGGPSLGQVTTAIRVLDAGHRQVDHAECDGPEHPATLLLPLERDQTHYFLHVDGGGHPVPGEKRILNLQIFSLAEVGPGSGGGDVVDPHNGVQLGAHWYPVEHFNGLTFRWMNGQGGQITVAADHPLRTTLRLVLEVGPSVGARRTPLTVRDAGGAVVFHTTLVGRQVALVPVNLHPGANLYSLFVESRGRAVPHDPRILNVRLLSAAVLR
jgi:hypothetical protein